MERFKQKLQAAAIPFRENEPLAAHCTFKIGGPAQLFVMPENEQQLCSAVALCKEQAVRYYLLGNGSNILFGTGRRDRGGRYSPDRRRRCPPCGTV